MKSHEYVRDLVKELDQAIAEYVPGYGHGVELPADTARDILFYLKELEIEQRERYEI